MNKVFEDFLQWMDNHRGDIIGNFVKMNDAVIVELNKEVQS